MGDHRRREERDARGDGGRYRAASGGCARETQAGEKEVWRRPKQAGTPRRQTTGKDYEKKKEIDPLMHSFEELSASFAGRFATRHFPEQPASLYDPAAYFLGLGGKRVRPVLCLMGN